jgi:small GTP-binding protein
MSAHDPKETSTKVVTVGDTSVGKSCLMKRMAFPDQGFSTLQMSTVGAERGAMEHKDYAFELWDTAGEEKYNAVTSNYLRTGRIILLCFALDKRASFDHLQNWVQLIEDSSPPDAKVIVVGTKLDLAVNKREVAQSEGRSFAVNLKRGEKYVEVSALSNEGINNLRDELVSEVQSFTLVQGTVALEERKEDTKKCC